MLGSYTALHRDQWSHRDCDMVLYSDAVRYSVWYSVVVIYSVRVIVSLLGTHYLGVAFDNTIKLFSIKLTNKLNRLKTFNE